jgi:hypothetical protein
MLKLALAASFFSVITTALVGATYEELKASAKVLEKQQSVIQVLVGACDAGGGAVNGECLENVKETKDSVAGKRVIIDLGSGHETMLNFGGRRGTGTRFVWAPLYDVRNGIALTVGKPSKLNNGNVVVNKRPIDGTSPDELMDSDLTRMASTGQLAIELVGKFGKTWSLSDASKTVKGVSFEVEGMRLYNPRTGKTVFESTQVLK